MAVHVGVEPAADAKEDVRSGDAIAELERAYEEVEEDGDDFEKEKEKPSLEVEADEDRAREASNTRSSVPRDIARAIFSSLWTESTVATTVFSSLWLTTSLSPPITTSIRVHASAQVTLAGVAVRGGGGGCGHRWRTRPDLGPVRMRRGMSPSPKERMNGDTERIRNQKSKRRER